ncbi:hypothetical protein HN51_012681 [Arachis hypogaea]|uniref:Bidirectional sugar transporter SWEET n=2 Tax=Arachis TaxID=3817 RepID=A0A445DTF1_ARAHY|nr:bidirectional sugar transporter N3 [Arachis duranensis]XP_025689387.1 bidirectional sugar transporter N3 [Arachis hypogaea]XP_057748874.1 bidirectional sugar transporter N3-like [Arachis stenosperma]QHO58209.1 Bidirectional sugar transporter [Arachis hypogaea]RYR66464.1 hypothetical protein Ahy_A03g012447 [Arachis hypogaea]
MPQVATEIFIVGVIGNICSFICFLAPLSTFYRVCKKKTTEGFQSIPYVAALFSAMLWIFYAYIKKGEILIITINSFGCFIETIYLAIYLTYCPKKARIFTLKLIFMFNLGGIFLVVLLTHVLAKERTARLELLGWICVVLSTSVFAAPLSIIRVVIRTKSVEFMPFNLSLLLTISAIMWMAYGILLKDIYVTLPNIVGVTFGTIQMVLYCIYRKNKPVSKDNDEKLPQHNGEVEATTPQAPIDIEIGDQKKQQPDNNPPTPVEATNNHQVQVQLQQQKV